MEYVNDRTYKRGERIVIEESIDASAATPEGGGAYRYLVAKLLGKERGQEIELRGATPMVEGEKSTIILTGEVGGALDDEYRNISGVEGALPKKAVDLKRFYTLKPLKVEGAIEGFEPPPLIQQRPF